MNIIRRNRLSIAVGLAATLTACGGGSSGSISSGATTSQAAAPQIQGTVASGNPVANAAITATDVNGKTATATADGNGNYTLVTSGLTAPIAVVASDPSGQVSPMISVLASLPAAGASATANVTTLTTALTALLTPDGNPMDFVTSGAATTLSSGVTTASVQAATSTLDTYLSNLLGAVNLPANFDPVGTTFTANHTGADALIDMLTIVPEGAATYLVYKTPSSASSQSAAYLTLSSASTPANTQAAPGVSANTVTELVSLQTYLSTLPAALQACGAAGGTGTACSGLIDASYEDNGFKNITQYDPDLSSSNLNLAGSVPFTVSVNSAGTVALIGIPYGLSSATGSSGQYTLYTTVQQTPSGTWDIVGNQLPYNLSVSTRTTYRDFYDSFGNTTGNPDVSFFDAGVTLNIAWSNTSPIAYANVTGPGLPAAGLWLEPSTVSGTNYLAIASKQPSSQPSGSPTTGSNTNEYRWDWATQAGVTFTPPAKGFWATNQLDVSSLPPSATYQFTLYNASGSAIGTYSVTNPNRPADATLGLNSYAQGSWPTLGSDVVTNFLSASGANAGAQTSVAVDFTPPPAVPSNLTQLTLTGVNVQSEDQNSCGYQQTVPVTPGTTSVTVTASGSGTCNGNPVANTFLAINNASDAAYRIVQLKSKNAQGVLFFLNATYRSSASAPNAS
jgi:hypothetical protein